MLPRIPENNKITGVHYAFTDDGLELPIIDITHPAFAVRLSEAELDHLVQTHLKDVRNQERGPAFLRNLILKFMQRQSFLMRGVMASAGTFMSGMNTYILKLGPENLSDSYATAIDRKLAAALPILSMRLRLEDVVRLMVERLVSIFEANKKGPLHLINIGGGSAIDSLNVLIVLQEEHPALLRSRQIFIHILDLDDAGPNFGRRALASLMADTSGAGPLHGLDIRFEHIKYDWSEPSVLRDLVRSFKGQKSVAAVSSEGALFEYGSDEVILANLRTLREADFAEAIVAGTVTRADEPGRILNSGSRAAINLRGLEAFSTLVQEAGWKITGIIDRPLSHDVLMEKT